MTQQNSRMPSSMWMLDRAERLFEKAKIAANAAEANSLRRMATNFLACAEAQGAPVGEIRNRYRYISQPERPAAEPSNNVVALQRRRAAAG